MDRKKILISCDAPRSLLDFRGKLMAALVERHEVMVFSPKIDQPRIRHELIHMGVRVYENELQPSTVSLFSDLKYLVALYKVIRMVKPDVFFPYTFKPVIYGSFVARFCRVARITPMLTGLGYNFLDIGPKTWVQKTTKILLKLSLKASKRMHVIFQNQDDYALLLREHVLTKRNKVTVVNGSGVDLSSYEYSPTNVLTISFLMISRLINAKGIREYYEAAKLIKSKFPDVNFKLIGPYEDNIDAVSAELYARIVDDGTIEYVGLVEDVRPYIRQSSVVVLPSYYGEGVPRCLLEGMAMGRALITCNSVGCRETINPLLRKANGFLVPVKDVQQLASKMEYYIRHPDDIIRFGINGRKYAAEKFDVNKVNELMIRVLEGETSSQNP